MQKVNIRMSVSGIRNCIGIVLGVWRNCIGNAFYGEYDLKNVAPICFTRLMVMRGVCYLARRYTLDDSSKRRKVYLCASRSCLYSGYSYVKVYSVMVYICCD